MRLATATAKTVRRKATSDDDPLHDGRWRAQKGHLLSRSNREAVQ
jgi:hypothetical protein